MQESCQEASLKKARSDKDAMVNRMVEAYQLSLKESPVSYTRMTERLAIKGLDWTEVTAEEVYKAILSILKSKSGLKSVKIYESRSKKREAEPFFGVAEFASEEVAKITFDTIDGIGFGDKSLELSVVPAEMSFENAVDECYKVEIGEAKKDRAKGCIKKDKSFKEMPNTSRNQAYDERFEEVFEDPDYFIDTTHEHYKASEKKRCQKEA